MLYVGAGSNGQVNTSGTGLNCCERIKRYRLRRGSEVWSGRKGGVDWCVQIRQGGYL